MFSIKIEHLVRGKAGMLDFLASDKQSAEEKKLAWRMLHKLLVMLLTMASSWLHLKQESKTTVPLGR